MKKRFYLSGLLAACFVLFSVAVKAAVPVINTNPHDTTVCAGTSLRLKVAVTNDTGITYSWQVSVNSGTSWANIAAAAPYTTVTTATLTIAANTTLNNHWYRAIAHNTSGSDTSSVAKLNVDSTFNVISGPSAVCVGNTITLSNTMTTGTWSSANDTATITSAGVVTGVRAGTGVINYSVNNSCGASVVSYTVTVNPIPVVGTITGANKVCVGSTIALSDTTSGGVWSSATNAIATVTAGGVVGGHAQGFDVIRYTTTLGSCTNVTTYTVRVDTTVAALPITGPTATCRGGFIMAMNMNTLGTGVWSSANTTVSVNPTTGAVTGVAYGSAVITYDFTNACNSVTSNNLTIQVDTVLNHGTITGPSIVCAGSWIQLNDPVAGGLWLSDNSAIANVDPSGNVTGVSQGVTTISYIFINACGSSAATHDVTVAQSAGPITGIDSVGVGATRILGNVVTGGTWSVANTNIAVINATTGVATGIAVGTTTVSYTVTNTCGTTTVTSPFYVGVAPSAGTIGGVATVCVGSSITLSTDVAGGVWTASNGHATVSASGVVTGISSLLDTMRVTTSPAHVDTFGGKAISYDTISYTVTNAFGSSTISTRIYVNRTPQVTILGPNIVALGGNYFFYGIPAGGTFTKTNDTMGVFVSFPADVLLNAGYAWATQASVASYVVVRRGTDTIHYRYTNACGVVDSVFTIQLLPVGVTSVNNEAATLRVFPNPNQGSFMLDLSSDNNEAATVVVTNMLGAKVKEFTIQTNQQSNVQLDQPAGLYMLNVITANSRYTTKITISK